MSKQIEISTKRNTEFRQKYFNRFFDKSLKKFNSNKTLNGPQHFNRFVDGFKFNKTAALNGDDNLALYYVFMDYWISERINYWVIALLALNGLTTVPV